MKRKIGLLSLLIILSVCLTLGNALVASAASQTVTLQPGPGDGKDSIIHQLSPGTNNGSNPQLTASTWTFSGTPATVRSVLGFDLSFIPPGSVIQSASLSLYAWDSTGGAGQHSPLSGSNACWLQRITSSWAENTVTWNNQPTTTTVNQVALPASTSPTQNYLNIDVTAMTQDMINNPSAGYGMMLRLQTESYYRRMNFCSSDHPYPAFRPKLVITYTPALPPVPVSISGPTVLENNTPMGWEVIIPSDLQNYNIHVWVQRGSDTPFEWDTTNKYISFSAYSPTPITITLRVTVTAPGYSPGTATIQIYTRYQTYP